MKRIHVTFDGTTDTTGYLFSLMKSLSASLRYSRYRDFADDIIASSGFAFRMWVDPVSLCPSAASIWEFKKQKTWVENGGLVCDYIERLWGEDEAEESRRASATEMIKKSIENDIAPVAWDISGSEWGIITGFDDAENVFYTLKTDGCESSISYEKLGKLDIPILSVLTVTGRKDKSDRQIVSDTKKLAVSHLRGEEWCDNAKGLEAYEALIGFVDSKLTLDTAWNLEYCLGTYASLKWYARRFFEKHNEHHAAELYKTIYDSWKRAFDLKLSHDVVTDENIKRQIIALLKKAQSAEIRASEIMAE